MPELPEVETVRRGLDPVMEGAVIAQADVNRPDLRWPFPPEMAARLTGRQVLGLRRAVKIHPRRPGQRRDAVDPSGHVGAHADLGRSAGPVRAHPPCPRETRSCGAAHGQRCARHLQRPAPLWRDGPAGHRHCRTAQAAGRAGARAAGQCVQRGCAGTGVQGQGVTGQIGASGSTDRRWTGQYLCLRSPFSRRCVATSQGWEHLTSACACACSDHPRGAVRCHRCGWIVLARFPAS